MPISTGQPVKHVRGQSRVGFGGRVLPDPRAVASDRFDDAGADFRVRPQPDPAVLERVRAGARPPAAARQVHGSAGARHPRGSLEQRGGGQRAVVSAQCDAGRGHQRAEGPAVLLLRV